MYKLRLTYQIQNMTKIFPTSHLTPSHGAMFVYHVKCCSSRIEQTDISTYYVILDI